MAELPVGTVTFLFSDIEGSAQPLKELGPSYADALADHQRILRAAFAAHGGREVDTQGDSFFVAFGRAKDAVAAAADAQRDLAAHAWPGGSRLRVRMATWASVGSRTSTAQSTSPGSSSRARRATSRG